MNMDVLAVSLDEEQTISRQQGGEFLPNLEVARTFLRKLVAAQLPLAGDGALYFELAFRDETQKNAGLKASMARVAGGDSPEGVADTLARMIPSNKAAYIGIVPRSKYSPSHATKDQVHTRTRVLWLDIDDFSGSWQDFAEKLPASPNWVTHSGHGLHLYFHLDKPVFIEQAESIMRELAERIGADHTFDRARVLRIPGTWNRKSEPPVLATLEEVDDTPRPADVFLALLGDQETTTVAPPEEIELREVSEEEIEEALDVLPWRIRKLIETGEDPEPGERKDDSRSANQYTAIVHMLDAGIEPAVIYAILSDPSFGISERTKERGPQVLKRDIERALAKRAAREPQGADVSFEHTIALWEKWLAKSPDPHRWAASQAFQRRAKKACGQIIRELDRLSSMRKMPAAKSEIARLQQLLTRIAVFLPITEIRSALLALVDPLDPTPSRSYLRASEWWEAVVRQKLSNDLLEHIPEGDSDDIQRFARDEIADVRACISNIWAEQYAKLFALRALGKMGEFFRTDERTQGTVPARAVYFRPHGHPESIESISSDGFESFLRDLNLPKAWAQDLTNSIQQQARSFRVVQEGRISRVVLGAGPGHSMEPKAIFIDMGDGKLLKLEPGQKPMYVENGEEVFLAPSGMHMWKYKPGCRGKLDQLCRVHLDEESAELSDDEASFLLKAWFVGNLVRGYFGVRPLLHIVGPEGQGKSTLATRLFLALLGDRPPANPPSDAKEVMASCAHRGFLFLDNLESASGELVDTLDRLAYSEKMAARQFYTNTGEIVVAPDVFVVITSISTSWVRKDLANRILPIHLGPMTWSDTFEESLRWARRNRDEILSEAVDLLAEWLAYIQGRDRRQYKIGHRLSPFAEFAHALAEVCGQQLNKEKVWTNIKIGQVQMATSVRQFIDMLLDYIERAHTKNRPEPYRFEMQTSEWAGELDPDYHKLSTEEQHKAATKIGKLFKDSAEALAKMGIRVGQPEKRTSRGAVWIVDYQNWWWETKVSKDSGEGGLFGPTEQK